MKGNVLIHILKMLFAIIVVSLLVDQLVFRLLNSISDQVYTGQSVGKLNHYLRIKDEKDVLVYGNSRVAHHVDPDILGVKGFNIGVNGRKIAYSSTLVSLLETNKMQTILFHIDTENAFSEHYSGDDIQALSVKYNRNKIIKEQMDALEMNNSLQSVFCGLSYNTIVLGIVKNYFKPNYDYRRYNGFDPIRVSQQQRKIFSRKLSTSAMKRSCGSDFRMNDIYRKALLNLRDFCKRQNKRLILFTSPMFRDRCRDDNKALESDLDKMGFEYYDFTDLFGEDSNLDYWKDRIHLSGKGAKIFSEKLRKRLNKDTIPYF